MKTILFVALVLLASCGTVHKVFTKENHKMDSVASSHTDSSRVSQQQSSTEDLNLKGVDVTITYQDSGYKPGKEPESAAIAYDHAGKPTKIARLVHDAVTGASAVGRVKSISFHIDTVSQVSIQTSRKDSGSAHTASTADVHRDDKKEGKEVTRTGIPLAGKLGIGFLILVLLAYLVYRFKQKIFPL